jgi:hypothetical protein
LVNVLGISKQEQRVERNSSPLDTALDQNEQAVAQLEVVEPLAVVVLAAGVARISSSRFALAVTVTVATGNQAEQKASALGYAERNNRFL